MCVCVPCCLCSAAAAAAVRVNNSHKRKENLVLTLLLSFFPLCGSRTQDEDKKRDWGGGGKGREREFSLLSYFKGAFCIVDFRSSSSSSSQPAARVCMTIFFLPYLPPLAVCKACQCLPNQPQLSPFLLAPFYVVVLVVAARILSHHTQCHNCLTDAIRKQNLAAR